MSKNKNHNKKQNKNTFAKAHGITFALSLAAFLRCDYNSITHVQLMLEKTFILEMLWQTVSESENSKKGCCCGRMAKRRGVVDIASCKESQKSRCSCLKKGQACTRLCRCVNCNNACQEEKSVSSQRKGCTCGSMKKGNSVVVCKDQVERKSRCPCLRIGKKCTSSCRCSNCGNKEGCPQKRLSSNSTDTKRKRTNPQTYKRMRGADYLAKEGFVVSNGPWTNLECIVLFVVTEVIKYSGVPLNSQNVAELYNFAVSSEKVKDFGLAVTYKPFSSIVGKLSQLNEKHSLHKSMMDSF